MITVARTMDELFAGIADLSGEGRRRIRRGLNGGVVQVDGLELLRTLPRACAGLVFDDPPWKIPKREAIGRRNGGLDLRADQEELVGEVDLRELVRLSSLVVVPDGYAFHWVGFHNVSHVLGYANEAFGFGHNTVISREVPNPAPAVRGLREDTDAEPDPETGKRPKIGGALVSSFDTIVVCHRHDQPHTRSFLRNYQERRNVRKAANPRGQVRSDHPAAKPIPLCRELIRQFTRPGDIVVDPFCGSGAILVAAALEGRIPIGGDIGYRESDAKPWAEIAHAAVKDALRRWRIENAPDPVDRNAAAVAEKLGGEQAADQVLDSAGVSPAAAS